VTDREEIKYVGNNEALCRYQFMPKVYYMEHSKQHISRISQFMFVCNHNARE